MKRRAFISGGLATASMLHSALAQTSAKPRHVGLFHVGLDHVPPSVAALRGGLAGLGYKEGTSLRFDWRNQASEATARRAAADFIREGVDVIIPIENQALRAAVAATKRVPIFFMQVVDPVAEGVVQTFAQPGGNVTGLVAPDLTAKRVEVFSELEGVPRRLLGLTTVNDARTESLRLVRTVARSRNVELVERSIATRSDIERAFREFGPGEVGAVVIMSLSLGTNFHTEMLTFAAQRCVPIIAHRLEWAEEGALLSYGVDFTEMGRVAALYVDKILKGAPPAQIPVDEAAGIRLIVNLKTARSLGITIPTALLLRADEVIE